MIAKLLQRLGLLADNDESAWLDWADQMADMDDELRRAERNATGTGVPIDRQWRAEWLRRKRELVARQPAYPWGPRRSQAHSDPR